MTRRHGAFCVAVLLFGLGMGACGTHEEEPTAPPRTEAAPASLASELASADLRPGDVLVSVNGKPVRSLAEATEAALEAEAGHPIELGIDRDGTLITVQAGGER